MFYKLLLYLTVIVTKVVAGTINEHIELCETGNSAFVTNIIYKNHFEIKAEIHKKFAYIQNLKNEAIEGLKHYSSNTDDCKNLIQNLTHLTRTADEVCQKHMAFKLISPKLELDLKELIREYKGKEKGKRAQIDECLFNDIDSTNHLEDSIGRFAIATINFPKCLRSTFATPYCGPLARAADSLEQFYGTAKVKCKGDLESYVFQFETLLRHGIRKHCVI